MWFVNLSDAYCQHIIPSLEQHRLGNGNDKSLKTYFGLLTVQSTVPAIQHVVCIVCQNKTIYLPV